MRRSRAHVRISFMARGLAAEVKVIIVGRMIDTKKKANNVINLNFSLYSWE